MNALTGASQTQIAYAESMRSTYTARIERFRASVAAFVAEHSDRPTHKGMVSAPFALAEVARMEQFLNTATTARQVLDLRKGAMLSDIWDDPSTIHPAFAELQANPASQIEAAGHYRFTRSPRNRATGEILNGLECPWHARGACTCETAVEAR